MQRTMLVEVQKDLIMIRPVLTYPDAVVMFELPLHFYGPVLTLRGEGTDTYILTQVLLEQGTEGFWPVAEQYVEERGLRGGEITWKQRLFRFRQWLSTRIAPL